MLRPILGFWLVVSSVGLVLELLHHEDTCGIRNDDCRHGADEHLGVGVEILDPGEHDCPFRWGLIIGPVISARPFPKFHPGDFSRLQNLNPLWGTRFVTYLIFTRATCSAILQNVLKALVAIYTPPITMAPSRVNLAATSAMSFQFLIGVLSSETVSALGAFTIRTCSSRLPNISGPFVGSHYKTRKPCDRLKI